MAHISEYHRPETMTEVLDLLARPDVTTTPLGGGTTINGLPDTVPDEVVDLQSLGIDGIDYSDGFLRIGAMATLSQISRHEMTPAAVVQLIKKEAPNTIRNAATIGGSIGAADPESPLLAALLAYDSVVSVTGLDGAVEIGLAELLGDMSRLDGQLIDSIRLTVGGAAAWESTGRTPADKPIVLVVGRMDGSRAMRLAATGVAPTPTIIDDLSLDELDPPADFRGSSEYRRHLAKVLTARVREKLGS